MDHPIAKLCRIGAQHQQFEILDDSAQTRSQLVGVHQSRKLTPAGLPVGGNGQEIVVFREQDPPQCDCPFEERFVAHFSRAVVLACRDVDPLRRKPSVIGDGTCTSM